MRPRILLLIACTICACTPDGDPQGPPITPPDDVHPRLRVAVAVHPGASIFPADTASTASVSWRVNGIEGGNAEFGFISTTGLYTAPLMIPAESVIVTADVAPNLNPRSIIYFIPAGEPQSYNLFSSRTIELANPAPTRLIATRAGVTSMRLELQTGGVVAFQPLGNNAFIGVIPHAAAIAGYRLGSLHNFVGFLDEFDAAGTRLRRLNIFVNIREPAHPTVTITPLGATAQRSAHVLNVRHDPVSVNATPEIVTRAVQTLGSTDFDFVAVVANVSTTNNRNYQTIRNDITGIAIPPYNSSALWGSGPRVQGAISYPIDFFFDAAEIGMLHEIGHRWITFSSHALLQAARPHWPMSTMASGIMGFSLAGGVGGNFPVELTPLGNGTASVNRLATPGTMRFEPFDLYLMGLLSADSVPPGLILPSTTTFGSLSQGAVFPVTEFPITDYIGTHGARSPSHAESPREFRMVSVVLSPFRLLTPAEMAFFDAAAARGETEVTLPSQSGFSSVDAPGFFVATGGRARLRTSLPTTP